MGVIFRRCLTPLPEKLAVQVGEQPPDNPPALALERVQTRDVGREQRPQLRSDVNRAALPILRRSRVEAQDASVRVVLAPLEVEDFTLTPPERRRDGHCDLQRLW
jgi:hypothetical protein